MTCLVDLVTPEVGVATARVLQRAGHEVVFPDGQTCCGQPAFNSGHRAEAAKVLRSTLRALAGARADAYVAPAGSCTTMIRTFAVRQPELSVAMADEKLRTLDGATTVCGADPSCLMHLRGRLRKLGRDVEVVHLAELLEEGTRGDAARP